MRVVFMGTPAFALPTLERVLDAGHEVVLVVTQPDKQAGRGRKVQFPPVKEMALQRGLEVCQPKKLRGDADFLAKFRAAAPEVAVVVAYGQILPPDVLAVPRYGCLNVHASLLPRYRGAAPINWAIANGDTETGVTIMRMDAGMDTGNIVTQSRVPILEDDDARSVADILSVEGAAGLVGVLGQIERQGELTGTQQDDSLVSYAPLLKKEDGLLDWTRTTEQIICQIRGMVPWPSAHIPTKRGLLKILRAEPLWPSAHEEIAISDKAVPGMVVLAMKTHGFVVRTGDGMLLVQEAQLEGKRPMTGVDFINGNLVRVGELLRV
ncbi:MAG TPA: methionyl-tRNA formyltransferase [Candidatus Sumerlaeota bacterium]|nr:methionyl-tRNA formyltransferase [Candidatus Sumerlaeota bacterium]